MTPALYVTPHGHFAVESAGIDFLNPGLLGDAKAFGRVFKGMGVDDAC